MNGYQAVLKILEIRQRGSKHHSIGCAKLIGKLPKVIPAKQTTVVEAFVHVDHLNMQRDVILEQPSASSLPNGLLVSAIAITLPSKRLCHLPVILRNDTNRDIVIPPKTVVAAVNAIAQGIHKEHAVSEPDCSQSPAKSSLELSFDFGDSPLSIEWKE